MSSDVAPLLIGFAAVGMLLILIGIVLATRGLFERIRLRPRRRSGGGPEGWGTSQEWVYRSRAPREGRAQLPHPTSKAEATAGGPTADHQGSPAAIEEAQRRAEEMLAAAERGSESLRRESQEEVEHRAVEITEDARRQARELLEAAELEAKEIVVAAGQERARLLNELARERAVVEETRTRLSTFLVDVLEEVEGPPAASEGPANVRDLSEARGVRTSAGADQ